MLRMKSIAYDYLSNTYRLANFFAFFFVVTLLEAL